MTPIPTERWMRPDSKAARVGAHSAVVWKRLYFRPFPASRSAVGVAHGPPNALGPAKPTSSSKMTSTLGAPAGGCSGSIAGNDASGPWRRMGAFLRTACPESAGRRANCGRSLSATRAPRHLSRRTEGGQARGGRSGAPYRRPRSRVLRCPARVDPTRALLSDHHPLGVTSSATWRTRVASAQSANERDRTMTETSLDELGPVDYVVVEFPAGASNFTGEMAAELVALVDAGTIRVIDVLILTKDEDGTVEATELSDVGELGELQAVEAELAELLAEEDVEHLAAAMEPNSTAGVLIWENLWAAPFASAARRSGGQLIANGRIPIQAIIASIEAENALTSVGD